MGGGVNLPSPLMAVFININVIDIFTTYCHFKLQTSGDTWPAAFYSAGGGGGSREGGGERTNLILILNNILNFRNLAQAML